MPSRSFQNSKTLGQFFEQLYEQNIITTTPFGSTIVVTFFFF